MANALAVMAWAPKGTHAERARHLHGQDRLRAGLSGRASSTSTSRRPRTSRPLAKAKGVEPSEITVCVLDRPRHAEIIASLRDGRRPGPSDHRRRRGRRDEHRRSRRPASTSTSAQGGAPEGVLACAALKCVGGQFQGRLVFRNADERARAARVGITDLDKKYDLHEMVRADAIFAATGVTNGALLDGVRLEGGFVHTHTLVHELRHPHGARSPDEAAGLGRAA